MVTAIRVQQDILGRLPDDASRMAWIARNADAFRKMYDRDASFRELVMKGDLDGIEAALDEKLN